MESKQCFICKSWMDEDQLVKGDDGFVRCYEHAYLNQETLIAALREAGEKMAGQLKDLRRFQEEAEMRGQSSITVEVDHIFNSEDAAALAEWEAANK